MTTGLELFERRRRRVRAKIAAVNAKSKYPRLSVFRSGQHIYAQIIDDTCGKTITAASSLEKEMREKLSKTANIAAALEIGKLIALRAKAAGIENVVFDRGGYLFHGRVKAVADGAREGGLKF